MANACDQPQRLKCTIQHAQGSHYNSQADHEKAMILSRIYATISANMANLPMAGVMTLLLKSLRNPVSQRNTIMHIQ